ncbi:MAG TPA: response regulator [Vicinamibacterales bacterium]|nr:response regulator [Vicinamibacterales bacterium]
MHGQRSVLVVDSNPSDLSNTVLLLQTAGYQVAAATAFDEAKQLLASQSPDLLITGLRLGPYNGLHLILRSRTDHPAMAAIVISPFPDSVLEAEAQRQNAGYLLRPLADGDFLHAVKRSLNNHGRLHAVPNISPSSASPSAVDSAT